ncbi:unnamed protein product [Spirodela intermedia]|uniref:AP180 N-terminal homology (ANTH) domain-containing protein n=1 Tax=Spirodela intermedia TaxID=51605 RepID=A0A7I8J4P2_SPIIN|nr:unnamed protein product [Spirodela intermedia]CAA6664735.1 unnamed protein product [Spirodela intermedia]
MDYKSAGKVFAWARTSPSVFLRPLMWALSRRVRKTRSWAVALKSLMLAHGVLLCCRPTAAAAGRLPFDLSSFHDRSSWGLSAFVRAYFNFLDQRSIFLTDAHREKGMRRVEKTQDLMELLMQAHGRPQRGGLPTVERIPEEDIEDLEMLLWFEASRGETGGGIGEGMEEDGRRKRLGTVVTENWVVFDDEPAPSGAAPCSCWAEPLLLGPPQNGL